MLNGLIAAAATADSSAAPRAAGSFAAAAWARWWGVSTPPYRCEWAGCAGTEAIPCTGSEQGHAARRIPQAARGDRPPSSTVPSSPLTEIAKRLGISRQTEAEIAGGLAKLALRDPLTFLGGALLGAWVVALPLLAPTVSAAKPSVIPLCVYCALGNHADCGCKPCSEKA